MRDHISIASQFLVLPVRPKNLLFDANQHKKHLHAFSSPPPFFLIVKKLSRFQKHLKFDYVPSALAISKTDGTTPLLFGKGTIRIRDVFLRWTEVLLGLLSRFCTV